MKYAITTMHANISESSFTSRAYRVLHLLVRGVLLQEDELLVQFLCHLHRHFLSICPYTRITVTCTAGHATLPAHCFHITEVDSLSGTEIEPECACVCYVAGCYHNIFRYEAT